jgi:cobalt-zinc-cadmium resistance protein CzcA
VVRVLKQVQGVADVVSIGGFVKEFHVEVDPDKLYSLGLSLDDVSDALSKSNRNVGGGLMRRGEQSFIIRGIGLLRNPQEIQDVVGAMRGKAPVTIGDVARVAQSHTPPGLGGHGRPERCGAGHCAAQARRQPLHRAR